MKTLAPLLPEYSFAGFTFPKYVWTLPKGTPRRRLEKLRLSGPSPCGPYQHAPKPGNDGHGFYLESDGMPGLRWQWADEVDGMGRTIRHKGWFCDDLQSETIRGVVFRLPKGRGFLAGWSMGEGMASSVSYDVHETEREAALAADREAELTAERERDYQEAERAKEEAEEQARLQEMADPAKLAAFSALQSIGWKPKG